MVATEPPVPPSDPSPAAAEPPANRLGELVAAMRAAEQDLVALAEAVPAGQEQRFFERVLQLEPAVADDVLEACFEAATDSEPDGGPRVQLLSGTLAGAALLAPRLPLQRSLVWSARIRALGQPAACPLVAVAAGPGPAITRARAAAIAFSAFADPAGVEAFRAAYEAADPEERQTIRSEAGRLCPELLAGV